MHSSKPLHRPCTHFSPHCFFWISLQRDGTDPEDHSDNFPLKSPLHLIARLPSCCSTTDVNSTMQILQPDEISTSSTKTSGSPKTPETPSSPPCPALSFTSTTVLITRALLPLAQENYSRASGLVCLSSQPESQLFSTTPLSWTLILLRISSAVKECIPSEVDKNSSFLQSLVINIPIYRFLTTHSLFLLRQTIKDGSHPRGLWTDLLPCNLHLPWRRDLVLFQPFSEQVLCVPQVALSLQRSNQDSLMHELGLESESWFITYRTSS